MPLEIEIKLKIADHAPVRERLETVGAEARGTVRETNIFFDRPDRSLRRADSGLRVRFTRAGGAPGSAVDQALLTFKGPASATGLRSREAFDLTLAPPDQIVPLLNALGFEQLLLFEKDRESWFLDDCHVELDTLPHFGLFMEIEGPSEEAVKAVQYTLGFETAQPEKASYSKMVGEFVGPRKLKQLTF